MADLRRRKPTSINQTDLRKDQEGPAGVPPSLFTAETLPQTKVSPPERFPPPPRRSARSTKRVWLVAMAVIVVVVLIFSMVALVLSLRGQQPVPQITPTPTANGATMTATPGGDTTPLPTQGVTQGPQNGPPSISETAYWDRILGTQGTNGKVEAVSFANVVGNPSLQALVTVRHNDANRTLDVYVFDQITNAKPAQLFKLSGLVKGDAKISYYNSVLTAEVDQNSPVNAGKSSAQWTRDLFREFAWNQGESTLVQVAFPGIFPDLTRYQAEMDQNAVRIGQDLWKTNAAQVAQKMATRILKWPSNAAASLLSGGGPQDVDALVQVKRSAPGGLAINVALSRLEGNTSSTGLLTITTPVKGDRLSSPVTISGTGSAFEGVIGQAFVLDHLYTAIGQVQVQVLGASNGKTTYRASVSYTSSFQDGTQEGIVIVFMHSRADGSIATAAMQKIMLSA